MQRTREPLTVGAAPTHAELTTAPDASGHDMVSPVIACERYCTQTVPRNVRFDFWRSLFSSPVLDHPLAPPRDGFHGNLRRAVTRNGTGYASLCVDPHLCRFGKHETDLVLFGLVRHGSVDIRHGGDESIVVDPTSGVVLYDCGRPLTTWSSRHALTYLTLPRATVAAAIGSDPVPRGRAARLLSPGPLTAGLDACLHQLELADMTDTIRLARMIHVTRSLALVALAGVHPHRRWWSADLGDALYTTACHQLALHLSDPRLTSGSLARSLGCSRAHLYRLFDARGETTAGRLRELRLRRAATLLHQHPQVPIGMIALDCGYTDLSAFGKAFRRRFDTTPRAWRAEALHRAES